MEKQVWYKSLMKDVSREDLEEKKKKKRKGKKKKKKKKKRKGKKKKKKKCEFPFLLENFYKLHF